MGCIFAFAARCHTSCFRVLLLEWSVRSWLDGAAAGCCCRVLLQGAASGAVLLVRLQVAVLVSLQCHCKVLLRGAFGKTMLGAGAHRVWLSENKSPYGLWLSMRKGGLSSLPLSIPSPNIKHLFGII